MAKRDVSIETHEFSPAETQQIKNFYAPEKYVKVGTKKWFAPITLLRYLEQFKNFKVNDDDIWLLGFSRCGTTAMQEMIWLIQNGVKIEESKNEPIKNRFPSLEHILFFNEEMNPTNPELNQSHGALWEQLNKEGAKMIKSHMPFEFLPEKLLESNCKKIYIFRNREDVIKSNYRIYKEFSRQENFGDFEAFTELFKNDLVLWAPFFDHVEEARNKRYLKNLLLINYEDLISKRRQIIEQVIEFLGKSLDKEKIDALEEYLAKTTFIKTI